MRDYQDTDGRPWRVWAVHPSQSNVGVRAQYQEGWLAFQSGHIRLRLVPIPPGWESAPEVELDEHRRHAHDAPAITES
jgi:hypothetical protein